MPVVGGPRGEVILGMSEWMAIGVGIPPLLIVLGLAIEDIRRVGAKAKESDKQTGVSLPCQAAMRVQFKGTRRSLGLRPGPNLLMLGSLRESGHPLREVGPDDDWNAGPHAIECR